MRFEVIMKADDCFRIYDDHKKVWCIFMIDGKSVDRFKTREEAFINLNLLNAGIF